MPASPVRLEADCTCDKKEGLLCKPHPFLRKQEQFSINTPSDGLPHELRQPSRRSRRVKKILWVIILLSIALCFLLVHTPIRFRELACRWLFLGSMVCRPATWYDVKSNPTNPAGRPRILTEIPQYVLDYAPYVHLYSEEQFWPCDMSEHLLHTTPELDYTPIEDEEQASNLTNLDKLNEYENGRHVFLTSNDNVEDRPKWLGGQKNIPNNFSGDRSEESQYHSKRPHKTNRKQDGWSDAPAVLVTVSKGEGVVDAFWFFFYSYNLGNIVLNVRFGNHVGDWEHTLVRFQHGRPVAVYFSEHDFGSAFSYGAVEKIGKRVSSPLRSLY